MGKFNESQRAIIGANCISAIQSSGNGKRVMVYCSSKEGGQLVAGTIQAAYGYKATKSENILASITEHTAWGFLGPIGTAIGVSTDTWKNFSVNTGSKDNSKKLVKAINSCITDYGSAGGGVDPNTLGTYGTGTETETGSGSGISKNTIYVIAGAVLAIVLVLVLTRKKK